VLLAALIGYALGAVPIGLIIGRLAGRIDLREHGSRRTGTTNALRVLGPVPAAIVLFLDIAKGLAAVLIAAEVGEPAPLAAALGGIASIAGHTWSAFMRFGGGRGVATAGGALVGMAPVALVVLLPVMLLVIWRSRYVSLASIVGALLAPIVTAALWAIGLAPVEAILLAIAAAVIIVVKHADNIDRLRRGTERRIGQREPASGP
jgi:acyl phosphate:glycerol-3-phosphate acyltransferase